ncbi:MAG: CPBP family intramembrane glutamic endopeptidase [Sphaerochaetaceae bacterium]|jgi:membrane protease YdiL (CAAX protease family)
MAKKQIIIYIVLSFLIAWILFLIIPLKGMVYGEQRSTLLLTGAMFAPAISSILVRLITKEGFKNMLLKPNFKGNIKTYLLIFFGPSLLIIVSAILYFLLFPTHFDTGLTLLQGAEVTPSTILLVSLLQVILVGPVINIVPTMGEELGWRGYLLPKLRTLFSDRLSIIISGIIWGLWHAPVIIMGHNYGTEYPGYPYVGILVMVVFCVALGIIEGYFTIKLNSVIPAAMVHSAMNAGAALPLIVAKVGINQTIGPTVAGLIGGLPLFLVAITLFLKLDSAKTLQSDQILDQEKLPSQEG